VHIIDEPTQKAFAQLAERMRNACDVVAHCLDVSPYVKKQRAHVAYCSARKETNTADLLPVTLAQVAQLFTTVARFTSAPPGQRSALNVLATCHASNAPGLSLVPVTMQVNPRE
jgi:hypothetical protein